MSSLIAVILFSVLLAAPRGALADVVLVGLDVELFGPFEALTSAGGCNSTAAADTIGQGETAVLDLGCVVVRLTIQGNQVLVSTSSQPPGDIVVRTVVAQGPILQLAPVSDDALVAPVILEAVEPLQGANRADLSVGPHSSFGEPTGGRVAIDLRVISFALPPSPRPLFFRRASFNLVGGDRLVTPVAASITITPLAFSIEPTPVYQFFTVDTFPPGPPPRKAGVCGLGFEAALLLAPLMLLRRRRLA